MALPGDCRAVSIPEAAIPVQLQSAALPRVTAGSDAWGDAHPDAMAVALQQAHPGADAGKSVDLAPDVLAPVGLAWSDAVAHPWSQSVVVPWVSVAAPYIRAAGRFAERSCEEVGLEAAEEQRVASPSEPVARRAPELLPRLASLPPAEWALVVQLVALELRQAE
jgi:hypothetical protein